MSGSVTPKIEAAAALLSHTGSKYKPHDVTYKPPQAGHIGRLVCYPGAPASAILLVSGLKFLTICFCNEVTFPKNEDSLNLRGKIPFVE
jgi:hypothetical protein